MVSVDCIVMVIMVVESASEDHGKGRKGLVKYSVKH